MGLTSRFQRRDFWACRLLVVALAGPILPAEPSTIVDVTGEGVVIMRHGGVSADLLREICPELVDAASA